MSFSSPETSLNPIHVLEIPLTYFPEKVRLDRIAGRENDEESNNSMEGHLTEPIRVGERIVLSFQFPAVLHHKGNGEETHFGELQDCTSPVKKIEMFLGKQGIAHLLIATRRSVWLLQMEASSEPTLEELQRRAQKEVVPVRK